MRRTVARFIWQSSLGLLIPVLSSPVIFAALVHYYDNEGMIHYVNTDYQQVPEEYADQVAEQLQAKEAGPLTAEDVYGIMLATYEQALNETFPEEFAGKSLQDYLYENSENGPALDAFSSDRFLYDEAYLQKHASVVQHFRKSFDEQLQLIKRDYPAADAASKIRMIVNGIISREEFIKYQLDKAVFSK